MLNINCMLRGRLVTHPPDPLPLIREGGVNVREGLRPSFFFFPLSFKGEGYTGGEVSKQSVIHSAPKANYLTKRHYVIIIKVSVK